MERRKGQTAQRGKEGTIGAERHHIVPVANEGTFRIKTTEPDQRKKTGDHYG